MFLYIHGASPGVISIFLRALVLQTDSTAERIDNTTFRVNSTTKPILAVFSPTNRWSYSTVGQGQCIISPTFCKAIDTQVGTSVSLVLLSLLLLIHH